MARAATLWLSLAALFARTAAAPITAAEPSSAPQVQPPPAESAAPPLELRQELEALKKELKEEKEKELAEAKAAMEAKEAQAAQRMDEMKGSFAELTTMMRQGIAARTASVQPADASPHGRAASNEIDEMLLEQSDSARVSYIYFQRASDAAEAAPDKDVCDEAPRTKPALVYGDRVVATAAASLELPLIAIPVVLSLCNTLEAGVAVRTVAVSYDDETLGTRVHERLEISSVKLVNLTAAVLSETNGRDLYVWNGHTFLEDPATGNRTKVCAADTTCSSISIKPPYETEELLRKTDEALRGAGLRPFRREYLPDKYVEAAKDLFPRRRKLGDSRDWQCGSYTPPDPDDTMCNEESGEYALRTGATSHWSSDQKWGAFSDLGGTVISCASYAIDGPAVGQAALTGFRLLRPSDDSATVEYEMCCRNVQSGQTMVETTLSQVRDDYDGKLCLNPAPRRRFDNRRRRRRDPKWEDCSSTSYDNPRVDPYLMTEDWARGPPVTCLPPSYSYKGGQGAPDGSWPTSRWGQYAVNSPDPFHNYSTIRVLQATYSPAQVEGNDGECTGVDQVSDQTEFLAAACDGMRECKYTVDASKIGDKSYNCIKNYYFKWGCIDDRDAYLGDDVNASMFVQEKLAIPTIEADGVTISLSCSTEVNLLQGYAIDMDGTDLRFRQWCGKVDQAPLVPGTANKYFLCDEHYTDWTDYHDGTTVLTGHTVHCPQYAKSGSYLAAFNMEMADNKDDDASEKAIRYHYTCCMPQNGIVVAMPDGSSRVETTGQWEYIGDFNTYTHTDTSSTEDGAKLTKAKTTENTQKYKTELKRTWEDPIFTETKGEFGMESETTHTTTNFHSQSSSQSNAIDKSITVTMNFEPGYKKMGQYKPYPIWRWTTYYSSGGVSTGIPIFVTSQTAPCCMPGDAKDPRNQAGECLSAYRLCSDDLEQVNISQSVTTRTAWQDPGQPAKCSEDKLVHFSTFVTQHYTENLDGQIVGEECRWRMPLKKFQAVQLPDLDPDGDSDDPSYDNDQMYYTYSCCGDMGESLDTERCQTLYTEWTDASSYNKDQKKRSADWQLRYLNRQDVECPTGFVLTHFKLNSNHNGNDPPYKWQYEFGCCPFKLDLPVYCTTELSTKEGEAGDLGDQDDQNMWIPLAQDAGNVACTSPGTALAGFTMLNFDPQYVYQYPCCTQETVDAARAWLPYAYLTGHPTYSIKDDGYCSMEGDDCDCTVPASKSASSKWWSGSTMGAVVLFGVPGMGFATPKVIAVDAGSIDCDNDEFGDPLPGTKKSCYCVPSDQWLELDSSMMYSSLATLEGEDQDCTPATVDLDVAIQDHDTCIRECYKLGYSYAVFMPDQTLMCKCAPLDGCVLRTYRDDWQVYGIDTSFGRQMTFSGYWPDDSVHSAVAGSYSPGKKDGNDCALACPEYRYIALQDYDEATGTSDCYCSNDWEQITFMNETKWENCPYVINAVANECSPGGGNALEATDYTQDACYAACEGSASCVAAKYGRGTCELYTAAECTSTTTQGSGQFDLMLLCARDGSPCFEIDDGACRQSPSIVASDSCPTAEEVAATPQSLRWPLWDVPECAGSCTSGPECEGTCGLPDGGNTPTCVKKGKSTVFTLGPSGKGKDACFNACFKDPECAVAQYDSDSAACVGYLDQGCTSAGKSYVAGFTGALSLQSGRSGLAGGSAMVNPLEDPVEYPRQLLGYECARDGENCTCDGTLSYGPRLCDTSPSTTVGIQGECGEAENYLQGTYSCGPTSSDECAARGGDSYDFCPETSTHYCCGGCVGNATCPSNPALGECACTDNYFTAALVPALPSPGPSTARGVRLAEWEYGDETLARFQSCACDALSRGLDELIFYAPNEAASNGSLSWCAALKPADTNGTDANGTDANGTVFGFQLRDSFNLRAPAGLFNPLPDSDPAENFVITAEFSDINYGYIDSPFGVAPAGGNPTLQGVQGYSLSWVTPAASAGVDSYRSREAYGSVACTAEELGIPFGSSLLRKGCYCLPRGLAQEDCYECASPGGSDDCNAVYDTHMPSKNQTAAKLANATMSVDACKQSCLTWGFSYTIVHSNLGDANYDDADDFKCWCGNNVTSLDEADILGTNETTQDVIYSYSDKTSPLAVDQDFPSYEGEWVAAAYCNADWTVTMTRGVKQSTESVTKDSLKTKIDTTQKIAVSIGYVSPKSGSGFGATGGMQWGWGHSDETSRESSQIVTAKEEFSVTWQQDLDTYGGQAMLWRWNEVIQGYPGYGAILTGRLATTRSMWEPPCCKPTPKLAYRDWRLGCPSDLVILNPETGKPRFNCWPYMNSTAEYTRYEAACFWDGFEKTPPGAMVRQHKLNYYDDCRDNCTARGDGCAGFQFGAYPYEIVPVCYHLKPSSCGECATMYNLPGTGKYRVGAPSWATTHIKVDFAVPGCPAPKDVTIEEGPGYKEIVWR